MDRSVRSLSSWSLTNHSHNNAGGRRSPTAASPMSPLARRSERHASFAEWRQSKRRLATEERRQAEEAESAAAAASPEHSPLQKRLSELRVARERHAEALVERQAHARRHTRAIRTLEGRQDDGAHSVPHYVALQASIAEQERLREQQFAVLRQTHRDKRAASREAFRHDAPSGEAARLDRLLGDVGSSSIARLLQRIGCNTTSHSGPAHSDRSRSPPDTSARAVEDNAAGINEDNDTSDGDESASASSAASVPDPGWTDEPPRRGTLADRRAAWTPEQRQRAAAAAAAAAADFADDA